MRILLITFLLFLSFQAFSQGPVDRIELGYQTTKRGIVWVRPGLPTHEPVWRISRDTNAILWHNLTTGIRYDWNYDSETWHRKDAISQTLPPIETLTSGLATIDNTTADWINDDGISHFYDNAQTAWVPLKMTYQSAAPTNVAAGVSNGAAVYTTTLWQDSDDFLIRFWDGDSWELIGGGTDLTFSGASSPVTLNSSTGTDVTFTAGTGISLAATGTNTTITNSAPDQTVSITGAGINVVTGTYPNFTVTGTEVDGSTSNELQTYGHAGTTTYTNTLSGGGGSWSITGAGIAAISQTAGAITVTATEVDGSISNEGVLGIGAGSGTSSTLLSTTSGANAVTINAAGILGISESTSANGGSITLTATEVDGSTTNELQTIANTSNSTSHTATLSNSGGSLQLVEGANITLTTTGATLDGIVTIAGNAGTVTSVGLALPTSVFDISGSPVTSSGTLTAAFDNQSANTVFAGPTTGGAATPAFRALVAADITTFATTGTGTLNYVPKWTPNGTTFGLSQIYDNGTSVSIGGGTPVHKLFVNGVTKSGGNIITAGTQGFKQALDGNNTVFGSFGTNESTRNWQVDHVNGGFFLYIQAAAAYSFVVDASGNVGVGTSSPQKTLHVQGTTRITGSDGTATTVMGRDGDGDISALSLSGMSISGGTLTATDGSTTNELQTIANTSDATSHTGALSNSGGSIQFVEGSGITLTTTGTGLNGIVTIAATGSATDLTFSGASSPVTLNSSTGTDVTFTAGGINSFSATGTNITITATEVDGSTTNELQTIANTSNSTSHTATLSNSGGSLQIIEGAGVLLTTGGTGLNGTVSIEAIDPSTTNEIQTYSASGAGPTSYDMTVSSGGTVTLAEGAGIDLTRSGNTITVASTATSGWLLDGNTITSAKRIGSNDNFDVVVETNGTDRMWFDNGGTVSIGATQLTTAALNINGLQNGIGQLIAGGSGLVTPSFYQATGSGSGSSATVFSGVISMLNGNVEALIQNTSASGSGGVVMELNSKTGTGDPRLYMTIDGTTDWSIGIDNDDVDNLKLHRFAAPSDNNGVGTMEFGYDGTSLGVAINKTGIGTAANAHYGLDVGGKVRGDQFVNNNPTSFTTGTIALGTAAGTGPSLDTGVSEFWGNGGRLKFTSGTSPTTNGVICTVTLGTEYTFEECAPIMQGRTTNTGGFDYVGTFNSGTRVITYTLIGTLAASTAYEFNLIVSGHN